MKKINKTTWQERIPIDVPDGFDYQWMEDTYILFSYVGGFYPTNPNLRIFLPHKIGDTKEIECDVCACTSVAVEGREFVIDWRCEQCQY